jgi:hypothetical protein
MRLKNVGVEFIEMVQQDQPTAYRLWSGDAFECPECLFEVIATQATQQPIAEHYEEGFAERIKGAVTAKEWNVK